MYLVYESIRNFTFSDCIVEKAIHCCVRDYLCLFFWFGVMSHRAILFYPFLIVFMVFLRSSKSLLLIPLGMAFVVLLSLFIFLYFDITLLASLFIRRLFFVTSHLTFTY